MKVCVCVKKWLKSMVNMKYVDLQFVCVSDTASVSASQEVLEEDGEYEICFLLCACVCVCTRVQVVYMCVLFERRFRSRES